MLGSNYSGGLARPLVFLLALQGREAGKQCSALQCIAMHMAGREFQARPAAGRPRRLALRGSALSWAARVKPAPAPVTMRWDI